MKTQDNEQVVREFMTDHDPRYLAEDVIFYDYTLPEALRGREAVSRLLDMLYRNAFPGAKDRIQEVIACEPAVAEEYIFDGVNDGNLLGNPATHREVKIPMCMICTVDQDQIREVRLYYDSALLTRQLGMGAASSAR